MRASNMFTISSTDGATVIHLPNPDKSSAQNTIATMVNSARNANAIVTAQKIGRDQEKTQLAWNYLEKDIWESLLKFWNTNFFFNFTYYSRIQGTTITRKYYISDRDDRPFDIDSNGAPTAYVDCTANLVDTGEGS